MGLSGIMRGADDTAFREITAGNFVTDEADCAVRRCHKLVSCAADRSRSRPPLKRAERLLNTSTETEPLYFEDLAVGDSWLSEWREISGDDVADFAELTGDHDPLHTDQAGASPFGQPIAHGLLGLSVLAGLSTNYPKAATLAFVGVSDWKFDAPIFFGDRVQVLTEVEELAPHGRRACRVVWRRKLINQDGRVVQQGQFISLVAAKSRIARKTSDQPAAIANDSVVAQAEESQRGTLPAR